MKRTEDRSGAGVKDLRKHAVILSGGGAKGAYEVGVMKALFPGYVKTVSDGREIHPAVFTGTSVGSYNAAYIVSRPDQDSKRTISELEGIWRNRIAGSYNRPNGILRFRANPLEGMQIDRLLADPFAPLRNMFDDAAFFAKEAVERTEGFFKSKERLTRRAIQLIDFSAFVSTAGLRGLIQETIDLDQLRRNAERALIISATNWEQGEVKLFGNLEAKGDLEHLCDLDDKIGHLAILASTAIPGIFPPVEIYHTKYVDGGLLQNTPLCPALQALRAVAPGEDSYVVHVIYLDPDLKDVPLEGGNNTMDTLSRLTALSFASQVNRDIKQAKHVNQSLELLRPGEDRYMEALMENVKPGELSEDAFRRESTMVGSALASIQKPFKAAVKEQHKPLTIHRYRPRSTLGGIFGLLAFESDYVGQLIELGFQDAVTHDCEASGCIFPTLKDVAAAAEASRGANRGRDVRPAAVTTA